MAVLFLPVLLGACLALRVGAAGRRSPPTSSCRRRPLYLNVPFFVARAVVYFAVWDLLACLLSRGRASRTAAPTPPAPARLRGLSGGGLVAPGPDDHLRRRRLGDVARPALVLDDLRRHLHGGPGARALAFAIVAAVAPRRRGAASAGPPAGDRARPRQAAARLHDALGLRRTSRSSSSSGRATSPRRSPWYLHRAPRRLAGGRRSSLLVFHFVLPFLLLLSRPLKRNARALAAVAALLLVDALVDLFWLIGPDLSATGTRTCRCGSTGWTSPPPLGLGGLWLFLFARQARRRPVLPEGEPELRGAARRRPRRKRTEHEPAASTSGHEPATR